MMKGERKEGEKRKKGEERGKKREKINKGKNYDKICYLSRIIPQSVQFTVPAWGEKYHFGRGVRI